MSTATPNIDFDRLLRLRLVVARCGEMDAARWWNTGDTTRRASLLGRAGSVLMSRGFPRTHRFAQARLVFAVARARCAEVFDPPGCVTLWNLPPAIEDQFDARWACWLEDREAWTEFFTTIEASPGELLDAMKKLGKGDVTPEPVKTQFGYHVIRVDDIRDAKAPEPPKFEDIKPQLVQQMEQQKLAKYQEELRAKAKVE